MIIATICLFIFLFTVYQLSKDDFIFVRRNMSVESIFNIVFLTLPVALFSARLLYVFFHPSWKFFNPLIFFLIPYFPGLSLVGGLLGAWLFITSYTKNKKMPSSRILDMISIAFLLSFSVGIFLNAIFLHNKFIILEEVTRTIVGIGSYIILLLQFIKGVWIEGNIAFVVICLCCFLSAFQLFIFFVLHQPLQSLPLIGDGVLFLISSILFIQKQKFISRLLGK